MAELVWDQIGERFFETGVDRGVLYPMADGSYGTGVVWNGLVSVSESPSGGEPNAQWADNIKYLNLTSNEEFGATIEAFTYPEEFAECDGSKEIAPGVFIGQQARKAFGLCYRTKVGNDVDESDHGYKLHLVYNAKAQPTDKSYTTESDSPEANTLSWEISTTPVEVPGMKPSANIVLDSTKVSAAVMKAVEDSLYGRGTGGTAKLPSPTELLAIIEGASGGAQG